MKVSVTKIISNIVGRLKQLWLENLGRFFDLDFFFNRQVTIVLRKYFAIGIWKSYNDTFNAFLTDRVKVELEIEKELQDEGKPFRLKLWVQLLLQALLINVIFWLDILVLPLCLVLRILFFLRIIPMIFLAVRVCIFVFLFIYTILKLLVRLPLKPIRNIRRSYRHSKLYNLPVFLRALKAQLQLIAEGPKKAQTTSRLQRFTRRWPKNRFLLKWELKILRRILHHNWYNFSHFEYASAQLTQDDRRFLRTRLNRDRVYGKLAELIYWYEWDFFFRWGFLPRHIRRFKEDNQYETDIPFPVFAVKSNFTWTLPRRFPLFVYKNFYRFIHLIRFCTKLLDSVAFCIKLFWSFFWKEPFKVDYISYAAGLLYIFFSFLLSVVLFIFNLFVFFYRYLKVRLTVLKLFFK